MSGSQIETLRLWNEGVNACDADDWTHGLAKFTEIVQPSAVILFNMGCAKLVIKSYQDAIEYFSRAVEKDNYMAVGYFQRAIGYLKCSRWNNAEKDLEKCRQNFRGKKSIDYKILGMRCNLHICEVLYNLAIANSNLGEVAKYRMLLSEAVGLKVESRHSCIDEALKSPDPSNTCNMPVLELPKCAIFSPPRDKVRNLQKQEYIQASKVVSALAPDDKHTGFMGPKRMKEVQGKIQESKSAPTSPNPSRRQLLDSNTSHRATRTKDGTSNTPPSKSPSMPPSKPAPRLPPATQPARPPLKDVLQKFNTRSDERKHSADDIFSARTGLRPTNLNTNNGVPSPALTLTNGLSVPSSLPARPNKPGKVTASAAHSLPPPNKPAPGFRTRPAPDLPATSDTQSKKQPFLPNKDTNWSKKPPTIDIIRVDFECNSTRSHDVKKGTSLDDMIQIACLLFDLNKSSIDLWCLDTNGHMTPILNDTQMQNILDSLHGDKHLKLWCYGKQ